MTCAVVLWVLLGTPAGYVSARLYKSKDIIYYKDWLVAAIYADNEEMLQETLYLKWWNDDIVCCTVYYLEMIGFPS